MNQLPNSFYATIDGMVENSRVAHPDILDALRTRDAQRARTLMERHILERSDLLAAMIDARELARSAAEPKSNGGT